RPARCAARHRRSPARSWYRVPNRRSTSGWIMPLTWMDWASSASASSRKRVRGWYGLGSIKSISTRFELVEPEGVSMGVGTGGVVTSAACECGSRMRAPSPRPSAFLAISNYLPCELNVGFSTFAINVVGYDRLSMTGCFGQPYVPCNYAFEDLRSEKASKV